MPFVLQQVSKPALCMQASLHFRCYDSHSCLLRRVPALYSAAGAANGGAASAKPALVEPEEEEGAGDTSPLAPADAFPAAEEDALPEAVTAPALQHAAPSGAIGKLERAGPSHAFRSLNLQRSAPSGTFSRQFQMRVQAFVRE
jgi:hypothetical protein